MAGEPASSSCIQVSRLLASHCVFGEGSGSIPGSSLVGQPALVLTMIVRVIRNQTQEVLSHRYGSAIESGGRARDVGDNHLRLDSAKIQSSHVILGSDCSSWQNCPPHTSRKRSQSIWCRQLDFGPKVAASERTAREIAISWFQSRACVTPSTTRMMRYTM